MTQRKEEENVHHISLPSMVFWGSWKFTGTALIDAKQSFPGKDIFASDWPLEKSS
jgi:hypothetical protein